MIGTVAILIAGAFVLPLAWTKGARRRALGQLADQLRIDADMMRETTEASRYDLAAARLVARTGRHPTNGEVIAEVEREAKIRAHLVRQVGAKRLDEIREAAGLAPWPGKPLNLFPVPQVKRGRVYRGRRPSGPMPTHFGPASRPRKA